jgi:hypothetical protein
MPSRKISPLEPTRKLGKEGQRLWTRIAGAYDLSDEGGRELLTLAGEAIDRAEDMKRAIDKAGLLIPNGSGVLRDNPLIRHEMGARAQAAKMLMRLGLDVEPLRSVGRPGHGGLGIRRSNDDDLTGMN